MSRRAGLLVLPGYLAAALLLTWPLAREARHAVPTVLGLPDALFQAFLLDWNLRTLPSRPDRVFDVPIFHPERNTLSYMDHLLGETVVAAPAAAATGSLAFAYDTVVWFSFVASAWAMYRLARLLGVSRGGAFACGLMFAFAPYRWGNMANLNLLQTQFLPLGVFFLLRLARSGRTRDVFATFATLAVQSYFSWYHTFHLATALVTIAAHGAFARSFRWRPGLGRGVLAAGVVTAAAMLPGLLPYLHQRLAMPGFGRSLGSAAFWSADVVDYLRVNVQSRALGGVSWLVGDQPYAPGWVATVLAGVAVVAALRGAGVPAGRTRPSWRDVARGWGDTGAFAAVAVVGFVLSLGPLLRVAGQRLWVPLPYAVLFYVVPGFSSMRAAGRFAAVVLLAVVALAGLGYERIRVGWARSPGRRAALLATTLAATVALAASTPWPLVAVPGRSDLPPVYRWLADRPGDEPVLDLPVPPNESAEGEREVTRQFYAVHHRKPLVDGVSGFVSPRHQAFRATMQAFPDSGAIQAAAVRGTRLVIVHYGDWPDSLRARVRAAVARQPSLRELAAFGDDAVYALEPAIGAPAAGGPARSSPAPGVPKLP